MGVPPNGWQIMTTSLRPKPGMMVSKGNSPNITLFQVCQLL